VGEISGALPNDHLMVVNLSGRGDKDTPTVAKVLDMEL
jgi:tryptophan synthase beta chain